MDFEYDPKKSETNLKKHGIALEEAKGLWLVPSVELQAKTVDEERFMIIGKLKEALYSCIYAKRKEKIRLISIRRSSRKEEEIYHETFQKRQTQSQ